MATYQPTTKDNKCIFCEIIHKESKADIIFEDDACLAFKPLHPVSDGHVLVVPKIHAENIFDINPDTLSSVILAVQKLSKDIVKERGATGINFLHASGKDAQQSVPHFHIHIVPRYPNDGLDLWLKNKL